MAWDIDEKALAIIALTIIALAVIFKLEDPNQILIAIISAIAGFVSGRAVEKSR